jgi:hypothetical protein
MTKTIIVRVERGFPHPKFQKVITGYKNFTLTMRRARPRWAIVFAFRRHAPLQDQALAPG